LRAFGGGANILMCTAVSGKGVKKRPIICQKCGGRMRIISFIEDHKVINKIVDQLILTFKAERPPHQQTYELLLYIVAKEKSQ